MNSNQNFMEYIDLQIYEKLRKICDMDYYSFHNMSLISEMHYHILQHLNCYVLYLLSLLLSKDSPSFNEIGVGDPSCQYPLADWTASP